MESCLSWLPATLPYDSVSDGHIVRTDRRSGNYAMDGKGMAVYITPYIMGGLGAWSLDVAIGCANMSS